MTTGLLNNRTNTLPIKITLTSLFVERKRALCLKMFLESYKGRNHPERQIKSPVFLVPCSMFLQLKCSMVCVCKTWTLSCETRKRELE